MQIKGEKKPIDGALRRFLDEQAMAFGPPQAMSDEARVRLVRERMVRALESRTSIPGLPNQVKTRDVEIAPDLAGRLYLPPSAGEPLPVLVYQHGGGWVAGSIASHDPFCCLLSEAAGVIILSVGFHSAPEYPFPTAVTDALTAARWAAQHAAEWGGDAARLALGGEQPRIGRHVSRVESAFAEDGAELVRQPERDEIGVGERPRAHQRADHHFAQEAGQARKRGQAADGEELSKHAALYTGARGRRHGRALKCLAC